MLFRQRNPEDSLPSSALDAAVASATTPPNRQNGRSNTPIVLSDYRLVHLNLTATHSALHEATNTNSYTI